MNLKSFLLIITVCCISVLNAQEAVFQTFKDTRVINAHTTEVLPRGKMDIRIGHRFGDLAGANGGWSTFYGLEYATDVCIGGEYGLRKNMTVGLYRSKGASDLRKNVSLFAKTRLFQQSDKLPVSATLLTLATVTTMKNANNPDQIANFKNFGDRMAYHVGLMVSRKFGNRFSLQLAPSYTYHPTRFSDDVNGIFAMGAVAKIQLNKHNGIILDATVPLTNATYNSNKRQPILGIGWEVETGGHVFQINFTNAEGIMETDYIPYTKAQWGKGEFRIGFTVSRRFNI